MEYKDGHITSEIIAASFEVHNVLGCGFPEVIYQRALEYEFDKRNINAQKEYNMPVYYKDITIGSRRVDFFVDEKICVELKAVTDLDDSNLAQAMNYLEASNQEIGLLLNFGAKSLQIKRIHNKKYRQKNNLENTK